MMVVAAATARAGMAGMARMAAMVVVVVVDDLFMIIMMGFCCVGRGRRHDSAAATGNHIQLLLIQILQEHTFVFFEHRKHKNLLVLDSNYL